MIKLIEKDSQNFTKPCLFVDNFKELSLSENLFMTSTNVKNIEMVLVVFQMPRNQSLPCHFHSYRFLNYTLYLIKKGKIIRYLSITEIF